MKSLVMSRKYSYIYKISKEIHKGTKISSNPFEKLANHCVEYKINRRNDEGCDPWSLLCSSAPLFSHFCHLFVLFLWFLCIPSLLPCCAWIFIQNEPRGAKPTRPGKLYSPRWVGCLRLKTFHSPKQAVLTQVSWMLKVEETSLAHASWLLAWANGTLKYCKNDPFALHLWLGS